jgi:hypothetical protein
MSFVGIPSLGIYATTKVMTELSLFQGIGIQSNPTFSAYLYNIGKGRARKKSYAQTYVTFSILGIITCRHCQVFFKIFSWETNYFISGYKVIMEFSYP